MILVGDALEKLKTLADKSVQTCVTSPPYWGLRDYGQTNQIGLEKSPQEYVEKMVTVFQEVRRVLADDGTLWLNLGDTYASTGGTGHPGKHGQRPNRTYAQRSLLATACDVPAKNLVGIPWRVALALQSDGWILRQDIIWHKPNPMPESVTDRCTKSHEYIFLLSKHPKYYFNIDAIKEPAARSNEAKYDPGVNGLSGGRSFAGSQQSTRRFGSDPTLRQKRSVWSVSTQPFKGAHFATFPPKLIEPCVLAGCPIGGTVLDPFVGAGTTWLVAKRLNRNFIGIELNPDYAKMATERVNNEPSPDLQRAFVK